MDAGDTELAIQGAVIAATCGEGLDAARARRRLADLAPIAPWHLAADVHRLASAADQPTKRQDR